MDYLIDLHAHTIVSGHAYSTIEEYAAKAAKKGLKLIGITDHAPSMPGSTHMFYFHNLRVIPTRIDGVEIFKGIEANIIGRDGSIDVDNNTLEQLDIVIASLHPPCIDFGTVEENTNTLINVMKNNKNINIIGHPDDARYPLNYESVVKAAKEYRVLLEVNNSSLNPKGFRQKAKENITLMLKECMKQKVPIVINSDAHISFDIGNFEYAKSLIQEIKFPEELIINSSIEKVKKFLKQ